MELKKALSDLGFHGPRYQWQTDKGKKDGRVECFGNVLDLGAEYASEGARPHPRAVLTYGPYTGRGCVSKAAQVASDAAHVLNEGTGRLPEGEPLWADDLERVPDLYVSVLSQQIARGTSFARLQQFQQTVMTEAASLWQFERTIFRGEDGSEYHIDVRRVK